MHTRSPATNITLASYIILTELMLVLHLILFHAYYNQTNASIIGTSLPMATSYYSDIAKLPLGPIDPANMRAGPTHPSN